jgi:hypothetical protein
MKLVKLKRAKIKTAFIEASIDAHSFAYLYHTLKDQMIGGLEEEHIREFFDCEVKVCIERMKIINRICK